MGQTANLTLLFQINHISVVVMKRKAFSFLSPHLFG